MNRTRRTLAHALATAALLLAWGGHSAIAQLPTSVDVDLAVDPAVDSLTVKVRSNGASFQQLMTALTFTIRWSAASGADLGARTLACPGGVPLSPTGTQTVGAFRYKTYNGFGLTLIQDECPGQAWTAGAWVTVMRVLVTGNTGCTDFNIVNDAWTAANNRDFFISLNGLDRTGIIEPTPDQAGNCTVDCLGQVGGAALPGTACNDGNACTANDLWSPACSCGGTFADGDGDGVCDANDGCPTDPNKIVPGICGCGVSDADDDGDGAANCVDGCPADPLKTTPGTCGCGAPEPGSACNDGNVQTVNDQVGLNCACSGSLVDCNDNEPCTLDAFDGTACQNTPLPDGDGDGACDLVDGCPADPLKTTPGVCGCGVADVDTDGDGTADCLDSCPTVTGGVGSSCNDGNVATINDVIGADCSCNGTLVDCNDNDPCTNDVFDGTACQNTALPDADADGTCDLLDGCPADPLKTAPGICGCGVSDADADGDGTADCSDGCPNDPFKTLPGQCGCGVADTDGDGDGTADCNDGCPADPLKTSPGICGCGSPDADTDADGAADCNDGCPTDPLKTAPGQCGCNVVDADADGDGTADCNDGCPADAQKTEPGQCGCGVPDTDTDGDGTADCNDPCPEVPGAPGDACDDGDAATQGDALGADCTCQGVPINDACSAALPITVQAPAACPSGAVTGSNVNAGPSGSAPSCAQAQQLADVWYAFNSGTNTSVSITLTPLTMGDHGFSVQSACSGAELACAVQPSGPVEVAVEPGTDLLVRVFGVADAAATGSFELCVAAGLGTGAMETGVGQLQLAPNPSDGALRWQWPMAQGTVQWEVFGATGALFAAGTAAGSGAWMSPEMPAPPPGVYMVRLRCGDARAERRWMVR